MLCAYLGYLQRCLSVRWWAMEPFLTACSETKMSYVTVELSEKAPYWVDDERWYDQSDHRHQMDHCHTLASQGGRKYLGRKGFLDYLCSSHLYSELKSGVHGIGGKESPSHGKDCLSHGLVGKPSTGQDGQTNSQHGKGSWPPETQKGLVFFFSVEGFENLLPNHSSPTMESRSAGSSRATDICNPGKKWLMIDVSSNVQLHIIGTKLTQKET